MREVATGLHGLAGDMRNRHDAVARAMRGLGRWHPAHRELDTTATWAAGEAAALTQRATALEEADGRMHLDVDLGILTVDLWLDLDAVAGDATGEAAPPAILERFRRDPDALAEAARFLDAHPSAALARALFAILGPAGVAALPSVVASAFPDDPEAARAVLASLSAALGRATRYGDVGFGPADLIDVWRRDQLPTHPAELLRYGRFSDGFVVAMAVAVLTPYASLSLPLPLPVSPGFGPPGSPGNVDPRVLVLDAAARDATCAVALVNHLADRGTLAALLAPATGYEDRGAAAGRVLARLGAAADPAGPRAGTALESAADRAITAVVDTLGGETLPLDDGVAIGAVAMIRTNLQTLVPSGYAWDGAAYRRRLVGTAPRSLHDLPANPRLDLDEAALRSFLAHVLASDAASDALLDVLATWVTAEVATRSAAEQEAVLDDVAAAAGRIAEIRARVLVEQGAATDAAHHLTATLLGIAIAGATSAMPASAPLWATLLTQTAGAPVEWAVHQALDDDNEKRAIAAAGRDDDYQRDLWLVLSVTGIWNTEPEWFGATPPPTEETGRLLLPDPGADPTDPAEAQTRRRWTEWIDRLPTERLRHLERLAGLALGQLSQADELEGGDQAGK
jgi:hypothetical protein